MSYLRPPKPEREEQVPLQKGDLAPLHFRLMPLVNVGGACCEYFSQSPFAFSREAFRLLVSPPYESFPVNYTFCRDKVIPLAKQLAFFPDSARYSRLIGQAISAGLVEEIVDCESLTPDRKLVILPFFAVIKDEKQETARPIENGHPTANMRATNSFSMPGATQIVDAFYRYNTANRYALHFDFSNCYFQYALQEKVRDYHCFRSGCKVFRWRTLTMGWTDATYICESFTVDLLLRAAKHKPESAQQRQDPMGLVELPQGAFAVVIYDSALVIGPQRFLQSLERAVCAESEQATLRLKYITMQGHGEPFEFCGFHLQTAVEGISWRLADSTAASWSKRTRVQLAITHRSLWILLGTAQFAITVLEMEKRCVAPHRQIQVDAGLLEGKQWDEKTPRLAKPISEMQHFLRQIIDNSNRWHHKQPRKRPRSPFLAAFDATPKLWAITIFSDEDPEISIKWGAFDKTLEIDEAEAFACKEVILAAEAWSERWDLVVIAGDNTAVLRAFHKGVSKSEKILAQMRQSRIQEVKIPIVFADLPSKENFSDIPTRPDEPKTKEECDYRKAATICRLKNALDLWVRCKSTLVLRHELHAQVEVEIAPDNW